jgi:hypothetical protein
MNVIVIQIYKITIFKRDLNTIHLSYIRMFNYYIFIIAGLICFPYQILIITLYYILQILGIMFY